VRETNKRIAESSLSPAEATAALSAWDRIDSVLGIGAPAEAATPTEILALAESPRRRPRSKRLQTQRPPSATN